MLPSFRILFAVAQLAWGQAPGIGADPAALAPNVEIIQPEPVIPDANAANPTEEHAPVPPADPEPRIWARAEYLLWFTKTGRAPPLVTTGLNTDRIPGALDNPSTRVLFGGELDYHERNGGRFSLGYFLDDGDRLSIEAGYLFLGKRLLDYSQTSAGNPVLARPFFDVVNNRQDASLTAFPGLISGSVHIESSTALDSAEANCALAFADSGKVRLDALVGFRYWHLQEDLGINENTLVNAGAPVFPNNTIQVADYFATDNSFYGGQLGLRGALQYERLQLNLFTKVALGANQEITTIRGATAINTTPATLANAGLLALASNSGRYTRDEFAVIPEVGVNLAVRVTSHLELFLGYSFMYWANVLRPGDQIDTGINPNLIPTSNTAGIAGGPARPAYSPHDSGFWAQGLNVGLELRY